MGMEGNCLFRVASSVLWIVLCVFSLKRLDNARLGDTVGCACVLFTMGCCCTAGSFVCFCIVSCSSLKKAFLQTCKALLVYLRDLFYLLCFVRRRCCALVCKDC